MAEKEKKELTEDEKFLEVLRETIEGGSSKENTRDTNENPNDNGGGQKTIEESVNEVLSLAMENSTGDELTFPEGTSPELQYAAEIEYQRRNLYAELSNERRDKSLLKAHNEEIIKHVSSDVQLSEFQKKELEELKFNDPDMWRAKMNNYEKLAREHKKKEIEEQLKNIAIKQDTNDLADRQRIMVEFRKQYPGVEITEDNILYDLPPRLTNKLSNGTVSFKDFLSEAHTYLKRGRVIDKGSPTMKTKNLSSVGGSSSPSTTARQKTFEQAYEDMIL